MSTPLMLLICLMALFALSQLARRSEDAPGTLRLLARPFTLLGQAFQQGATTCREHLKSALEWPPKANVIARLVYLALALSVFAGDFALARLRSAAFFGVRAEKLSWLPLDSFSGLLWLCVSALWGIVLLDLIDLIPPGWRLIPVERLSKPVRIIATLLALALFAVSAITMAFFVFWGQVQISSLSTSDTTILGLNLSFVFGSLLGLSSAIALWALFVGIAGAYIVVVALSYVVLRILSIFAPSTGPIKGRGVSPEPEPEVNTMVKQDVTRNHLGNYGYRSSSLLDTACEEIGASRYIRLQSVVDLSRPRGGMARPASRSIKDITPHNQIDELIKAGTHPDRAYGQIMDSIVRSTVDSYIDIPVIKGHVVNFIDLPLLSSITESLQQLHRRLPSHSDIISSALSDQVLHDKRTGEALESLQALYEEEIIQNALLIHTRSPFAKRVGEETQERFQAKFLASLLDCHNHSTFNRSFGEVFEELSTYSPYSTLSFASVKASPGKATFGQRALNILPSGGKEKRIVGRGDLNDCIAQTLYLFQEICKPQNLAMVEQGVSVGEPLFFLVNVPIPLDDKRFKEYRNAVQQQLTLTHPKAQLIVVRGGGTPETKGNPGFYIQCTVLHPLTFTTPEEAQVAAAETSLTPEIPPTEAAPTNVNSRRKQPKSVA